MSSLFRMLLIAILAEEETREEEKDRWDKVKNTVGQGAADGARGRSCITVVTLLKWIRKPERVRRR